jgi:hypothetical protein
LTFALEAISGGICVPASPPASLYAQRKGDYCARWNTQKNTATLKQAKAWMNEENSMTAGTKPRRTLRKSNTNLQTKRAVIRIVPIRASKAAFLSVMMGV